MQCNFYMTIVDSMLLSLQSGFGTRAAGKNTAKQFTFDFAYWSVSQGDDHYCDQEQVWLTVVHAHS